MLYQDLGLCICVPKINFYRRLDIYLARDSTLHYYIDIGNTLMSVLQRNQLDVFKLLPDSVMACLHG